MIHLLPSAVEKLFLIRVLECEGGDFTRDTSLVLVHPAPALPEVTPPFCACLGIRQARKSFENSIDDIYARRQQSNIKNILLPANCRDLPLYAFCGYMKFRHSLFRTTTYELLTENQKVPTCFFVLLSFYFIQ